MITLEQACSIIKDKFPKHKIQTIVDIGKSWVFGISYGDDDYPLICILKETGQFEHFEPTEHYDEIDDAFDIEIPKEYA